MMVPGSIGCWPSAPGLRCVLSRTVAWPKCLQRPGKGLEYWGFSKMLQLTGLKGFAPIDRAQRLVCQVPMASRFSRGF